MGSMREIGRALIYGIVGGLVVTILAIWAGTRDPLTLLYAALVTFLVVAIAFEGLQQPWTRNQLDRLPWSMRWPITWKEPRSKPVVPAVELGFLDYEMAYMHGTLATARILNRITAETQKQTGRTVAGGRRMVKVAGGAVEQRHRVARGIARDVESFAKRLDGLEREYGNNCELVANNGLAWINNAPDGNDFASLQAPLASFGQSVTGYRDALRETRRIMQDARQVGVSQDVNRAYERAIVIIDNLIADSDRLVEFSATALTAAAAREANKKGKAKP